MPGYLMGTKSEIRRFPSPWSVPTLTSLETAKRPEAKPHKTRATPSRSPAPITPVRWSRVLTISVAQQGSIDSTQRLGGRPLADEARTAIAMNSAKLPGLLRASAPR